MNPRIEEITGNSPAEEWNSYVAAHRLASVYHLFEWHDVIHGAFGNTVLRFAATGVFPVGHLNSRIFGNYGVSVPYFNYGGPLAADPQTEQALIEAAVKKLDTLGAAHLEIRCHEEKQYTYPVKTGKVVMHLPLPADTEELFKSFPAKLRSQIRRPEKEGMEFRSGKLELLDDFYKVFAINMRDLGTPVYGRSFFERILTTFSDRAWLGVVYHENKPVAAGFVIGFRGMMEIPWASSLREYNRYSPNMMLYWNLLKLSVDQGFTVFDFGRSTPGEGTHRFKKQWGSEEKQLYWYYWLKGGGDLPELNPHNPKYQLAIRTWQKLPVWLTKIIGPSIVKNLP
jgi:serine/alanine adding enzyme